LNRRKVLCETKAGNGWDPRML
jgi:hypothetical protein